VTDTNGQLSVPHELVLPGLIIVAGLLADLLQYFIGAIIWFIYYRVKEAQGVDENTELSHSVWLEAPIHFLFWAKAILFVVAYYYIFVFLFHVVSFK
jgi:hypothetical protein